MDNKTNKKPSVSNGTTGVIAIVVVGIFVLCVIVLLAKGIFTSNSAKVPDGLDTATINTNTSSAADIIESSSVDASAESSADSSSLSESSTADSEDSSKAEPMGTMYVTEYSYLHVAPDKDAENIVCMSPGVEVTVLEYEDNGYVKITFQNIDGPLTGYLYKDYLTTYNSQTTAAAPQTTVQTQTQAVQTQAPDNQNYQNNQTYTQNYGYAQ